MGGAAGDTIRLLLAGDVMLGRGIDQVMASPVSPELFEPVVRDARAYVRLAEEANGPIPAPVPAGWVWGEALAAMERLAPDLRLVNLETAVTAAGTPWAAKEIHYRMHPAHLEALKVARIDACVLANNHVLDWGSEGLEDTLASLEAAGIGAVGAGRDRISAELPLALRLPRGGRLLVSAWAHASSGVPPGWAATPTRSGVAELPSLDDRGLARIAAALEPRRRPGDRVVVSLHWGGNWVAHIPAEERRFAHLLIEAGLADLVHGHSSHHPLPHEIHRGRLILYGCGDLINDYEGIRHPAGAPPGVRSDLGCLHLASLDPADGQLLDLEVVPFRLRRFRLTEPEPGDREDLERLLGGGSRPGKRAGESAYR
jgi:poly-gamma-glutamate synthesis protein (capsule biosynthesis protein)